MLPPCTTQNPLPLLAMIRPKARLLPRVVPELARTVTQLSSTEMATLPTDVVKFLVECVSEDRPFPCSLVVFTRQVPCYVLDLVRQFNRLSVLVYRPCIPRPDGLVKISLPATRVIYRHLFPVQLPPVPQSISLASLRHLISPPVVLSGGSGPRPIGPVLH